jgi:hypothetical protein
MEDVKRLKNRFIATATALSLVCAGLLVYLLWPSSSGPSPAQLQGQYNNLKLEVASWQKNNPEKVRSDLNHLYSDDVPTRWSEISQRMTKLFQATGVSAPGIHYELSNEEKSSTLPGVQQIKIDTTVTGEYSKVASFINALEQDKTLFIINKISLSGQEAGAVSLSITINTFLKQA